MHAEPCAPVPAAEPHTTASRAERLLPTTKPAITVTCVLYDGNESLPLQHERT